MKDAVHRMPPGSTAWLLHGAGSGRVRAAARALRESSENPTIKLIVQEDEAGHYSKADFDEIKVIPSSRARSVSLNMEIIRAIKSDKPDVFVAFSAPVGDRLSLRSLVFSLACGSEKIFSVDSSGEWKRVSRADIILDIAAFTLRGAIDLVDSVFAFVFLSAWAMIEIARWRFLRRRK